MNDTLPLAFIWNHPEFIPIRPDTPSTLLVADSWRVCEGTTWGLEEHLARFMVGMATQHQILGALPNLDVTAFEQALAAQFRDLASRCPGTDFFPRISVEAHEGSYRVVLLVRRAPEIRASTTLRVPEYTDPRIRPTIKGPDIDLMRGLVAEASTDDIVLHDGTNVIETTTGALLVWRTPQDLVLCQATQQLASISAQRIAHHARSRGISVTCRPVTIHEMLTGEYPVWFTNTLHGISPVTTIGDASGETHLVSHPDTAAWQAAWWKRFVA